eukprot:Rmarinus@m.20961
MAFICSFDGFHGLNVHHRCNENKVGSLHPSCPQRKHSTIRTLALLSRREFEKAHEEDCLRIAMVGMSNTGKSYRSKQLKDMGYSIRSVDEEIENAIRPELEAQGFTGIEGMASWMGMPYDPQYPKNSAAYLALEESVTMKACQENPGCNYVIDTTGSVIQLHPSTLRTLRDKFLIVHLEASDAMLVAMMERFFAHPKPVAWGDCYEEESGESGQQALKRCYPHLLRRRGELYSQLAHVTVPATKSTSSDVSVDEFLELIMRSLPERVAGAA